MFLFDKKSQHGLHFFIARKKLWKAKIINKSRSTTKSSCQKPSADSFIEVISLPWLFFQFFVFWTFILKTTLDR